MQGEWKSFGLRIIQEDVNPSTSVTLAIVTVQKASKISQASRTSNDLCPRSGRGYFYLSHCSMLGVSFPISHGHLPRAVSDNHPLKAEGTATSRPSRGFPHPSPVLSAPRNCAIPPNLANHTLSLRPELSTGVSQLLSKFASSGTVLTGLALLCLHLFSAERPQHSTSCVLNDL